LGEGVKDHSLEQNYKNVEKEASFFLGRFLRPQDIEVFAASVHFVSHLAPAVNASVFVLVTVGQNEEEIFPHRNSASTLEAVKFRGFELFELGLLFLPRLFRNIR
jgi:hypothetical protein